MKRIIYAVILLLGLSIVGCQKEGEDVKVSSISLNMTSVSLTAGSSATLVATISPSNATNKKVVWMSSNASVASVNNGTVTAIAEGEATITAISEDSGANATCKVNVTKSGSGPVTPTTTARLTRIIYEFAAGGHCVTDIKYDEKGRLVQLLGFPTIGYDSKITFTYDDATNRVFVCVLYDGIHESESENEYLLLNDDGLCISDSYWTYSYFNGHLASMTSFDNRNKWSYVWENDCLKSETFCNERADYPNTYDSLDNPFYGCPFDPFLFLDNGYSYSIKYGFCGMSSKKLLKTRGSYTLSYAFSGNGRLSEYMVSHNGKVGTICYLSYSDEIQREPRKEITDAVPAEIIGDWILTGRLCDGEEQPYTDISSETYTGVNKVYIFSIGPKFIKVHGYAVCEDSGASFSNGILYGVDKNSDSTSDDDGYEFVYKFGKYHDIGDSGEWGSPVDVTFVSEDKFYCNSDWFPESSRDYYYIYERVKEIK